jgi:pimeloyl-ACP methyl ester carboxylesterase
MHPMTEHRFNALIAQESVEIAYTHWGDPANPRVVVCVHGLTRNSRDFDDLARHLSRDFRVICPDVVGRGKSSPLTCKLSYLFPNYVHQMLALLAHLELSRISWVGTSMGGIIGMTMAALPQSPIERLVINDIGPHLPQAALANILLAVDSANVVFPDIVALKEHIKIQYASFGNLTEAQWDHMARHSAVPQPDGGYRLAFDPGIRHAFEPLVHQDAVFWEIWEQITSPCLVLRGENSDLLLPETTRRMAQSGPRAQVVEIADVGHAPALMDEDQIAIVAGWLREAIKPVATQDVLDNV